MAFAREHIDRRALLGFATNYNSTPEAIMELVDNPIDYRGDQHLNIDIRIDRDGNAIHIRDHGGQGMNDSDLHNWLIWGGGEAHAITDIGQFHVGGKLASIYLADKIQITCRRAGESTIWHFRDDEWGVREEIVDREITQLRTVSPASWISSLPVGTGFVSVALSNIKHWAFDDLELREALIDAYEVLMERGDITISVNDRVLGPNTLPWLLAIETRPIRRMEVMPEVFIEGRIGALDRRELGRGQSNRIKPGIRTDFNGRRISHGEEFGFHLSGRGAMQRLFGELSISGSGFHPNQNKTGWDIHALAWREISDIVQPIMREVLADLKVYSASGDVSNDVKRRRNALTFQLSWLNESPEREIASQVQQAARLICLSPRDYARRVVEQAVLRDLGVEEDQYEDIVR